MIYIFLSQRQGRVVVADCFDTKLFICPGVLTVGYMNAAGKAFDIHRKEIVPYHNEKGYIATDAGE
jgi:hypothetical protein